MSVMLSISSIVPDLIDPHRILESFCLAGHGSCEAVSSDFHASLGRVLV